MQFKQMQLLVVFTICCLFINTSSENTKGRNFFPKRLPLYTIFNFPNSPCTGNNGFNSGVCLTGPYCRIAGGTPIGRCANNFGVCCLISRTCGSTTQCNNTNFQNPNYPIPYDQSGTCSLNVVKSQPNICQLRLNFLEFRLAPPRDGQCLEDSFTINCDGSSDIPTLCGNNTGQHVYINFPQNVVSCSLNLVTNGDFERNFNIQIQQIPCTSNALAPSGCLQYHRSITGTIQSFNTDSTPNTGITYPLGLNYGICIRQDYGFCSIQYSLSPNNGYFQMDFLENQNLTTSCEDSLIIPKANPQVTRSEDRYCGTNFPVLTSSAHPFAVYVTSDDDPQGGQGFRLNFLQVPCRQ